MLNGDGDNAPLLGGQTGRADIYAMAPPQQGMGAGAPGESTADRVKKCTCIAGSASCVCGLGTALAAGSNDPYGGSALCCSLSKGVLAGLYPTGWTLLGVGGVLCLTAGAICCYQDCKQGIADREATRTRAAELESLAALHLNQLNDFYGYLESSAGIEACVALSQSTSFAHSGAKATLETMLSLVVLNLTKTVEGFNPKIGAPWNPGEVRQLLKVLTDSYYDSIACGPLLEGLKDCYIAESAATGDPARFKLFTRSNADRGINDSNYESLGLRERPYLSPNDGIVGLDVFFREKFFQIKPTLEAVSSAVSSSEAASGGAVSRDSLIYMEALVPTTNVAGARFSPGGSQ